MQIHLEKKNRENIIKYRLLEIYHLSHKYKTASDPTIDIKLAEVSTNISLYATKCLKSNRW